MTPDIWKAIGGLISLVALVLAWFFNKNDEAKKALDDEDKKIDSLSDASDIMRESGKLRK